MDNKTLYVDMDGVLARFNKVSTETLLCAGYFENLEPQENVVHGVRILKERHPEIKVQVLSCYLIESDYALNEKKAWLNTHLPELAEAAIFVPCGTDKASIVPAHADCYLLDDYTENLFAWENSGLKGIKLFNDVNGTKGRWQGRSISYLNSPQEIAEALYMYIMQTGRREYA